jgi:hypothetical protein
MLASRAGLELISWHGELDTDDLLHAQQAVLAPPGSTIGRSIPAAALARVQKPSGNEIESIFIKRTKYLRSWSRIDDFLCWKTSDFRNVYNFGAGLYSHLLAAYCPRYWKNVEACLIDGYSGSFGDKNLISALEVSLNSLDCIVVGTRPPVQKLIKKRFSQKGIEAVTWESFVQF